MEELRQVTHLHLCLLTLPVRSCSCHEAATMHWQRGARTKVSRPACPPSTLPRIPCTDLCPSIHTAVRLALCLVHRAVCLGQQNTYKGFVGHGFRIFTVTRSAGVEEERQRSMTKQSKMMVKLEEWRCTHMLSSHNEYWSDPKRDHVTW